MAADKALRQAGLTRAQARPWPRLRRPFLRRIWLPRYVYEAIPWLYLGAGSASLIGALYLPGWTWTLPYLLLFGLACLHAGAAIANLRRRYRRRRI